MRTTILILAAIAAVLPLAAAANPQQSGSTSDCIDDLATFFQSSAVSPIATRLTTQAGSFFSTSSSAGAPFVDFFNAAGQWVGWNAGAPSGRVPSSAAFGTMCVGTPTPTGIPVPNPAASWTYQDGF